MFPGLPAPRHLTLFVMIRLDLRFVLHLLSSYSGVIRMWKPLLTKSDLNDTEDTESDYNFILFSGTISSNRSV